MRPARIRLAALPDDGSRGGFSDDGGVPGPPPRGGAGTHHPPSPRRRGRCWSSRNAVRSVAGRFRRRGGARRRRFRSRGFGCWGRRTRGGGRRAGRRGLGMRGGTGLRIRLRGDVLGLRDHQVLLPVVESLSLCCGFLPQPVLWIPSACAVDSFRAYPLNQARLTLADDPLVRLAQRISSGKATVSRPSCGGSLCPPVDIRRRTVSMASAVGGANAPSGCGSSEAEEESLS